MQTMNFTKRNIEAIEPPAKGFIDVKDSQRRYLRIRTTAAGNKTFYFVRKSKGSPIYRALGRFPDITIAEARESCDKANADLLSGETNKPAKLTFGELFQKYIDGHAKPYKKTWQEDQRKHDTLFSQWDKKRIEEITREHVNQLHTTLGKQHGQYLANRNLALLKVVFNFGRETLGLDIKNPCDGVKKFKEQDRDRFLNAEELRAFFESLNSQETPPQWKDFFLLCLWTGARRGNVLAMQWPHLDLNDSLWQIPGAEFKNGEQFKIFLTEPALDILKRRKLEAEGTSRFVFPANSKTGHATEPRKAWANITRRAGLDGLRIHDLRRTLGSWQAASGASLQVIGKCLGHRNQETTEIYSRLNLEPVKAAMNTATAAMIEAMNGDKK